MICKMRGEGETRSFSATDQIWTLLSEVATSLAESGLKSRSYTSSSTNECFRDVGWSDGNVNTQSWNPMGQLGYGEVPVVARTEPSVLPTAKSWPSGEMTAALWQRTRMSP